MADGKNGGIWLPKWVVAAVAFLLCTVLSAILAWAVNTDNTQRCLLQDVSSLQEHKANVIKQLDRIESKLDSIVGKVMGHERQ